MQLQSRPKAVRSVATEKKRRAVRLPGVDADTALLLRWQQGDQQAGEALYTAWVGHLTRFFRNKVSDDDEVPDLVAQSFMGLTQSKDGFRGDARFPRYLYQVARKVLASHLRKRYKRAREVQDFGSLCIAQVTPHGPSSLMQQQHDRRVFLECLRGLTVDDQIMLELRYFEGLTGPELAELLDIPEGTVRGRIARATARLTEGVRDALGGSSRATSARVNDAALDAWAAEIRVLLGREPS